MDKISGRAGRCGGRAIGAGPGRDGREPKQSVGPGKTQLSAGSDRPEERPGARDSIHAAIATGQVVASGTGILAAGTRVASTGGQPKHGSAFRTCAKHAKRHDAKPQRDHVNPFQQLRQHLPATGDRATTDVLEPHDDQLACADEFGKNVDHDTLHDNPAGTIELQSVLQQHVLAAHHKYAGIVGVHGNDANNALHSANTRPDRDTAPQRANIDPRGNGRHPQRGGRFDRADAIVQGDDGHAVSARRDRPIQPGHRYADHPADQTDERHEKHAGRHECELEHRRRHQRGNQHNDNGTGPQYA
ncbi:MAG TPA: hypothetical protein ENN87_03950 [Phycisphaerales bacterium]|nr:hypothetical protein [Phycisphaerales bacterium]